LEILTSLWNRGEAAIREVLEDINQQRALRCTSILKTIQIMIKKGLVQRTEAG
jgi:predicted transcriptional regulator